MLSTSPLIRTCLLEERSGDNIFSIRTQGWCFESLKWTFHNVRAGHKVAEASAVNWNCLMQYMAWHGMVVMPLLKIHVGCLSAAIGMS